MLFAYEQYFDFIAVKAINSGLHARVRTHTHMLGELPLLIQAISISHTTKKCCSLFLNVQVSDLNCTIPLQIVLGFSIKKKYLKKKRCFHNPLLYLVELEPNLIIVVYIWLKNICQTIFLYLACRYENIVKTLLPSRVQSPSQNLGKVFFCYSYSPHAHQNLLRQFTRQKLKE